jgi:SAM-dependent methyltransferase
MEIYDENYRKKLRNDVHNKKSILQSQRNKAKFFQTYCKNKKVLDLGSLDHHPKNAKSEAWLFSYLQEVSSSILGLDYNKAGVKELQKDGYPIVFGDAQSFHFKEKFDVVTAGDLIEHLLDLNGFFISIKNILKKKGSLVLSTPNPWCWKYILYHLLKARLYPINREHTAWFCIQTLIQLSGRFGFKYANHIYSSERAYENFMPLPTNLKHTTLNIRFISE